jgi:hypothetical protein
MPAKRDWRSSSPFIAFTFCFSLPSQKKEGRRNAGKRWSPPPHLAMRLAPHEGALVYRRSTTALT